MMFDTYVVKLLTTWIVFTENKIMKSIKSKIFQGTNVGKALNYLILIVAIPWKQSFVRQTTAQNITTQLLEQV